MKERDLQNFPNVKTPLLQVWDESEVEQGMSSDLSIVRFFYCNIRSVLVK